MTATRNLRRPRILIVGCGDVGLRCVESLRTRARLFALTSQPARRTSLRAAGTTPLIGDLDVRASLARLAGLAPVVLHLAPPEKNGDDDRRTRRLIAALGARRRSPARSAVSALRVWRKPVRRALAACGANHRSGVAARTPPMHRLSAPPRSPAIAHRRSTAIVPDGGMRPGRRRRTVLRVVYASTTGVYGDCGGARIDETRRVHPANARAKRRASAERQLRRATARGALVATIARIPGIYAADRLPLARLEKGTPALADADDVYTSHIHADDLAAILVRLATHGRPARVIHASDDSEMKMGDYFDRVADAVGVARPPRVARADAERQLDPMLLSFMRESRRVTNGRLKRELRIRLRYPRVDDLLLALTRARS